MQACSNILRVMKLVLLFAAVFPMVSPTIYVGHDVAGEVSKDVKARIDQLVEQKLRLYMSTYFDSTEAEEGDQYEADQTNQDSDFNVPHVRIRRNSQLHGNNETIDGSYSLWSSFGPCSASCGKGTKQRSRTCTAPTPENNGENCTRLGPAVDIRYCTVVPCIAESFVLKQFQHMMDIRLPYIMDVKQFKIGSDHYVGMLSNRELQLYKWNDNSRLFAKHKQAIPVHHATSFDIFSYIVDHYLILAETVMPSYAIAPFTRILSYNDATKTFDFRKQIMLTLPHTNKVIAFNVFGQPHAAFIQFESKAPGHRITTNICDRQTETIGCPSGSSITIQSAFYGRKSWSVCNHGWFFNIDMCSAPQILEKVAMMCNNKSRCSLKSPPAGIPDPCPVFTKYLTVTYTCDKKMHKNSPRFYVWKSVSFQVIPSDSLVTYGAADIEAFELHHKHFVVVANHVDDDGSHHLDSEIFIYSSNLKRFVSFQKLRTDAAVDWEFFSIGDGLATEYFLAVANHFKMDKSGNREYSIDSVIYKWNWNLFVPFQCIKAYGARKWSALKGKKGEFLLTLSSDEDHTVTTFSYDGWRFHPTEEKLRYEKIRNGFSVAYALSVKTDKILFVINVDTSNTTTGDRGHMFNVTFTSAYPRYKLLNSTLHQIKQINETLDNLTSRFNEISETLERKRSHIVFLSDNKTISGFKYFENVEVSGDLNTNNSYLKAVNLSKEDDDIIERQKRIQDKLTKQDKELIKLEQSSSKILSKNKNQVINASFTFENHVEVENLEGPILNVSGAVNGEDLSEIADTALYIDKNHTIYGKKIFEDDLQINGNLHVIGRINQVNTSNIVTLSTDQAIYGKKTLMGNLDFLAKNVEVKNVEILGRLDGVFISKDKLLRLAGNQTITGDFEFMDHVRMKKNVFADKINNLNLSELYEQAVLLDGDQTISSYKYFKSPVKVIGNLSMSDGKTVDFVDVSELQQNILSRTKDQNISKSLYFGNDVVFKEKLEVGGFVNDIKVPEDVVFLSKDQEITGKKYFTKKVQLNQNLDVHGFVNHINVSGNLLTVNGNQNVTGKKTFGNNITVHGNIKMNDKKTVDGVDLSALKQEAVYLDTPQVITGDIQFTTVSAVNVSVICNETCFIARLLKNLTDKTVKINKAATIAGLKTFTKDLSIYGNVTVDGFVNGMKLPDDFVLKGNRQIVHGGKIFKDSVHIDGNVTTKSKINDVNITEMYDKGLRMNGSQNVTGRKHFIDALTVKGDLHVSGTINKIDINDLVKLHGNENITARKTFRESIKVKKLVADKMEVGGLIDHVNITELNRTALRRSGHQVVSGNVTFEDGFTVAGSLNTGDDINGVNLTHLSMYSLKKIGNQSITGKKIFLRPVTVRTYLDVQGLVDGVNITELFSKRVTLDGNQTIQGKIILASDSNVIEETRVRQLINGMNITKLKSEALYLHGNQSITGFHHYFATKIGGSVNLGGTINGIDLSKETVTLNGNDTVYNKTFMEDIVLLENLNIAGSIDGVNITRLREEAVYLFGVQVINAKKTFRGNLYLEENLEVDGLVDGVNVTELNLTALRKNFDQTITGSFVFLDDVNFTKPVKLVGFVNGINLTRFHKNVVTKSTAQTIIGKKTFNKITVYGDVSANQVKTKGTINDVDLSKLKRMAVLVNGQHRVNGVKTFNRVQFDDSIFVKGTVNGLNIPRDVVLLSTNQTIKGVKIFEEDLVVTADIVAEPNITIDNVDVSELALNAVYLNQSQTILSRVQFNNVTANSDVVIDGLVNDLNMSRHNLLLRKGKQTVKGVKTFSTLNVKGNLSVEGTIDGVDVNLLNTTSVFVNRNNVINATKEITGDLVIKGNVSADLIDGVRVKDVSHQLKAAEETVDQQVWRLSSTTSKQKRALNQYVRSVQTLHPKLDFFTNEQTIILPATTVSFDAVTYNNSVLMVILDNGNDVNSSIYKKEASSAQFLPYGKLPTHHGSDIRMLLHGSLIHAAVSSKQHNDRPSEQSTVYTLNPPTYTDVSARRQWETKHATHADIVKFNNQTLGIFTNTYDGSNQQVCVSNAPFFLNSGGLAPIASLHGCNIKKVVARQLEADSFLLVSLNSGLYNGRNAVLYKVNMNGSYSIMQTLPTYYATDALLLKVKRDLYLIIANEYEYSEIMFKKEYKVPVQIYKYNETSKLFSLYQELNAPGAMLLNSFNINRYTYLVVASSIQAVKIFQFKGAGKFELVDSVLNKGPNHIKRVRSWNVGENTYVGMLSMVTSPTTQNILNIFKAAKTAKVSAEDINNRLKKVNSYRSP